MLWEVVLGFGLLGGVFIFWFCVWIFYVFFRFLVDHAVLLMFDVAGIIKAALGWFYSFPSLSLVCICSSGSRKSKDFASVHLSEDSCALQVFGEAFAGFCGWVLNQQLVLQYVRE